MVRDGRGVGVEEVVGEGEVLGVVGWKGVRVV